jgi:hypothetical protein
MDLSENSSHRRSDSSEALCHLSAEVNRIAAALAQISRKSESREAVLPEVGRRSGLAASLVRNSIKARDFRERIFGDKLFVDPAWNMMLELFYAELSNYRVSVSSLCIASRVAPTTALRWIKMLENEGVFIRERDPNDGRRIFVDLSPSSSGGMQRYFNAINSLPI